MRTSDISTEDRTRIHVLQSSQFSLFRAIDGLKALQADGDEGYEETIKALELIYLGIEEKGISILDKYWKE